MNKEPITQTDWGSDTDVRGTYMVCCSGEDTVVCRGIKTEETARAIANLPKVYAAASRLHSVLAEQVSQGLKLDEQADQAAALVRRGDAMRVAVATGTAAIGELVRVAKDAEREQLRHLVGRFRAVVDDETASIDFGVRGITSVPLRHLEVVVSSVDDCPPMRPHRSRSWLRTKKARAQ